MLAVIYLVVCLFFGVQLLRLLFPDPQRIFVGIAPRKETLSLIPTNLFFYPAGFVIGLVFVTILTYIVAYIMTPFMPSEMPVMYPANIVSLCASLYCGSLFWQKCFARRNPEPVEAADPASEQTDLSKHHLSGHVPADSRPPAKDRMKISGYTASVGSVLFYLIPLLFITAGIVWLFFYSFHVTGSNVVAGWSVFSDLSPHTAILSSFSHGVNFPTEYPHFPGEGIRYHFLFYFLCGNLNMLGMRIDYALNIPSILTAVSCLILLGVLAVLLSWKRITFILAPLLVLFRSSYAIVDQIRSLAIAPGATVQSVFSGILSNKQWIGTTPHDSWGLWAINVYANQRHLLLGVALILVLLFLFLPHVRRMFLHVRKAPGWKAKVNQFLFSREAWLPRRKDPIRPYALGGVAVLVVVCMPYFHGSALIAGLLILFFLSIFSENRVTYAVVAAAAVGSSVLQAQFFSGGAGNVVSFSYVWGFIVEDPTVLHVLIYLAKIMGVASILLLILLFAQRSAYRTIVILAFALPAVLAFVFQTSVDITANHKFIQISIILFTIFISGFLAFLWMPFTAKPRPAAYLADADSLSKPAPFHPVRRILILIGTRILAVLLFISLTATGISEWIVYYNVNTSGATMSLNSPMVSWIENHTKPKDVFLTASFTMNSFFLSGRSAFYGYPYYAMTAGYDTYARKAIYIDLLSGCGGDLVRFRALCAQEHIAYIMIDNTLRFPDDSAIAEGFVLNESFFIKNFSAAAAFPNENNTVIYSVN